MSGSPKQKLEAEAREDTNSSQESEEKETHGGALIQLDFWSVCDPDAGEVAHSNPARGSQHVLNKPQSPSISSRRISRSSHCCSATDNSDCAAVRAVEVCMKAARSRA